MDIEDVIRDIEDWAWPYEGTFKNGIIATVDFIRRNYESTEIHYSENSYWVTLKPRRQQDPMEGSVRTGLEHQAKD